MQEPSTKNPTIMQIAVEMKSGYGGLEVPQRFSLDGREIEVSDNLDQWHGADCRYFKLKGDDGNLFVLRASMRGNWNGN